MKILAALIALSAALSVHAQTASPQGSTMPDASIPTPRPADDMGSGDARILPGERGGMPDNSRSDVRAPQRCQDLPAALRDECLLEQRGGSSVGAARAPERGGSSLPPAPPGPLQSR
jgi:hypothetical protein